MVIMTNHCGSIFFFHYYLVLDFRETMDNAKIKRIMEERNSLDEINFKKAGVGPLQKTFKHDPTARN